MRNLPILIVLFVCAPLLAQEPLRQRAQQLSRFPFEKITRDGGVEPEPVAKSLAQAREDRIESLRRVVNVTQRRYAEGSQSIVVLTRAMLSLAEAEHQYAKNDSEKLAACKKFLALSQYFAEYQDVRVEAGAGGTDELHVARASLAKAEIMYLEEIERQKRNGK